MSTVTQPGVIFNVGGPIHQIRAGKNRRTWCFEMHRALGPMLCRPNGDGLKREPLYVMQAITWWAQQGRRVDASGYCVYESPARFG